MDIYNLYKCRCFIEENYSNLKFGYNPGTSSLYCWSEFTPNRKFNLTMFISKLNNNQEVNSSDYHMFIKDFDNLKNSNCDTIFAYLINFLNKNKEKFKDDE